MNREERIAKRLLRDLQTSLTNAVRDIVKPGPRQYVYVSDIDIDEGWLVYTISGGDSDKVVMYRADWTQDAGGAVTVTNSAEVEQQTSYVEVNKIADGEIVKVDEERRQVFGWAYVAFDKSGQIVYDKSEDFVDHDTLDDLEKSAYDFVLESRVGDDQHDWGEHATMIESVFFSPEKLAKMGVPEGTLPVGWWVGFRVDSDELWELVKDGKRSAFSIGGTGTREKVDG